MLQITFKVTVYLQISNFIQITCMTVMGKVWSPIFSKDLAKVKFSLIIDCLKTLIQSTMMTFVGIVEYRNSTDGMSWLFSWSRFLFWLSGIFLQGVILLSYTWIHGNVRGPIRKSEEQMNVHVHQWVKKQKFSSDHKIRSGQTILILSWM